MASTSNAYDFDLFDSRDHGSAAPKLPEPKAPQKQKQKNNVVKLDEKQLRRSHRHSANTVSYTHLDVYKRQVKPIPGIFGDGAETVPVNAGEAADAD